jgi:hypothetical protein
VVSTKKHKLSRDEIAQILENFLQGKGNPWDWDDFTSGMSLEDSHLEEIRIRCSGLSEEFPPDRPYEYCNEKGRDIIRIYIRQLITSG